MSKRQDKIRKEMYNTFFFLFRLQRAKQGRTQKEFMKLCKKQEIDKDTIELFEIFMRAKGEESKSYAELKKKMRIEYLTGVKHEDVISIEEG